MTSNYLGVVSGYIPLQNISSFNSSNIINANQVTVNSELSLPYISAHSVLLTDANSDVVGQALTDGQVLIGSTGLSPVSATITPVTNQTTINNTAGSITIGTVQNINTTSEPTFKTVKITDGITHGLAMYDTNNKLTYLSLAGADGNIPISAASGQLYSARLTQSNNMVITNGAGSITLATSLTPSFTWVNTPELMNTGTLTLPTITDVLVGRNTADTLTNKILTTPTITSLNGGGGLLTMPATIDTLVGRDTTDTLTNKTLTSPTIVSPNISGLSVSNAVITDSTLIDPFMSTIMNTGTLTLPTITDTLVGTSTTDVLTNKSLKTDTCFFVDPSVTTKKIGFNCSASDASQTVTIHAQTNGLSQNVYLPNSISCTLSGVALAETLTNKTLTTPTIASLRGSGGLLTMPGSTDTLVGRATADTLTNKTLTSPTITTPHMNQIWRGAGLLTLPLVTSTLLARTDTALVSNKTFEHINCYFVNASDPTIQLKFLPTGTTGIQGTLRTNFTTAKTIQFPDATDTVLCNDFTAVVKNKKLDESNTFVLASDHTRTVKVICNNANSTNMNLQFFGTTNNINHNVPNCNANTSFIMGGVASGSQTINNSLTCFQVTLTGWLKLPTSGGTASALAYHEESVAVNSTASGPWASAQTMNIKFSRTGTTVRMTFLADTSASATSTNEITWAGAVPTRLCPSIGTIQQPVILRDGNRFLGQCFITNLGSVILGPFVGGFTVGNLAGWYAQTITYDIVSP